MEYDQFAKIKESADSGELYGLSLRFLTPEQGYRLAFGLLGSVGREQLVREMSQQATQQITAPDRLPHSRSEERSDTEAGGG